MDQEKEPVEVIEGVALHSPGHRALEVRDDGRRQGPGEVAMSGGYSASAGEAVRRKAGEVRPVTYGVGSVQACSPS